MTDEAIRDSKPGKRLEKIIELIEIQANKKKGVTVKSPVFLPDKLTGEPREFDVVITVDTGHHRPMTIGIECRDRSRPVGVPDVEAFYTKCRDAEVHQGIIVSSNGFAMTARKKAQMRGIRCLELNQAEQFDWCQAPGIFGYEKRAIHLQIYPDFEGTPSGSYTLYEGGTIKVGPEETAKIAQNALSGLQLDPETLARFPANQVFVDRGTDHNPNFIAVDENGDKFKIKTLTIDIYFQVAVTFVPFQYHEYLDPETGKLLSVAASADMTIGGRRMTLAITGKADGPKRVMISPEKTTPRQSTPKRKKPSSKK